jgi:nickel transport protein
MKHFIVLCLGTAAGFFFSPLLYGHGVDVSEIIIPGIGGFRPLAAAFSYSTGEVFSYAYIKAYPPSNQEIEVIKSLTDRNGVFCFIPDEEGNWRLDAEDGMGHKATIILSAGPKDALVSANAATGPGGGKTPPPLRITLGLSLILNIFALWHFIGTKKKGRKCCF